MLWYQTFLSVIVTFEIEGKHMRSRALNDHIVVGKFLLLKFCVMPTFKE
jgi:hypothetical protein